MHRLGVRFPPVLPSTSTIVNRQSSGCQPMKRGYLSLIDLCGMFPDEMVAIRWLEEEHWPDGKGRCPPCACIGKVYDVSCSCPMP